MWTNIKKLYARNNIFKKIILNMRFATIYILVQFSFFGGLLQGILASFFKLSLFRHFTLLSPPPPPTIKNFPTNTKKHSPGGVVCNRYKKYITEACLKALQLYFKTSLRFPLEFCKIFRTIILKKQSN